MSLWGSDIDKLWAAILKISKRCCCNNNFGFTEVSPPVDAPAANGPDVLFNKTTGEQWYWDGNSWESFGVNGDFVSRSGNISEDIDGTKTFLTEVYVPYSTYDSGTWDANTSVPTKAGVKEAIDTIVVPAVSDVAYDATTWNANLDAPSKNAVRDKFEALPTFAFGTYTPTITNETNIASTTVYDAQYMRVGNVVNVSGNISIDPTLAANTVTQIALSLPISTTAFGNGNLGGVASTAPSGTTQMATGLFAQSGNKAILQFISIDTNERFWSYTFQYVVA